MLRFSFLGFPVVIHWVFWLTMAMLGGGFYADTSEEMQRVLVWVVAGFLSIFIHELGHALTMRHYGAQQVHIVLHGFGGYANGIRRFSRTQDFFVSAAGPFFQIAAGVAMWWLVDEWPPQQVLGKYFMDKFINVSLFWAVLNLFPIIPLDGGHIMQAILGPRRQKIALIISMVCAVGFGIWALTIGQIFIVIFFAMFAFNNWKQWKGEPPTMMP
ncbi:site-2 protease family protein [Prosthecobacter dejongeii]|uniref:Zn-dependent protease n=1 Tax=Prosthecobacter dejongeii TaxID=48465 RepID=A0A7W8DPQ1_9BACT|nr:M50 family metallopeptidase [Prosthecobacter dejongeii]MBB5037894.1 Zn-dependent protease [Prosthecobacter dejongeii]